ncbi:unnamed protein product [Urochloa humidicola]
MGNLGQHLRNATLATTSLHYQLSDLWRSPRGTVLRIEALALVAITLSFFLAAFGSCRRWSNRWIIQKGFLAAQVLSLSLGTYSIGLMQSSSVKSEMYPIWAVSLFTLFGCVDPVITYIGLDYKGPLLKMIFQLCLYCGYVLLMTVSTNFGGVGKLAIGMLSAITFIKGFYRSLALVLPSRTRNKLGEVVSTEPEALAGYGKGLRVYLPQEDIFTSTSMADIHSSRDKMLGKLQMEEVTANGIEDVCLGYSLSHILRRHFLGLDTAREMELKREKFESLVQASVTIDCKRTLKAIEVELAFLYEVFFTSNEFLHCYEARTSSFWAFSSFIGICFLGVATAIPGTMTSPHHHSTSSSTSDAVVHTTTADLIITLFILVSLALLQLVQLIRCWTSNWARVAFACEVNISDFCRTNWFERMIWKFKVFSISRMNWFDNKYLWQDKLGQYSLVDGAAINKRGSPRPGREELLLGFSTEQLCVCCVCSLLCCPCQLVCFPCCWLCGRPMYPVWLFFITGFLPDNGTRRLGRMLGLQYIEQVARELWVCDNTSTAARLQDNVKTSIADFLDHIKGRRIGKDWTSLFVHNGIDASYLPFKNAPLQVDGTRMSDAYAFTHRVMVWHVATCYCEPRSGGGEEGSRRVAIALSKYCAYLVVSAPELLPGPSAETKRAFDCAAESAGDYWPEDQGDEMPSRDDAFVMGVYWGRRLLLLKESSADPWKLLELLWVQTLLYAAPYGDVQAHMQRLSQGGEFITHLWALLFHLGIDSWEQQQDEEGAETVERRAAAAGEREPARRKSLRGGGSGRRASSVPAGPRSSTSCTVDS